MWRRKINASHTENIVTATSFICVWTLPMSYSTSFFRTFFFTVTSSTLASGIKIELLLTKDRHDTLIYLFTRWMDASSEVRENLLISIFPRMTICMWETFGSAGGREREWVLVPDNNNGWFRPSHFRFYLCLLSTNNIVEKIFLFLWFWFLFLLIVSLVSLTYFCVMAFSRNHDIRMYFLSFAVRIRVTYI